MMVDAQLLVNIGLINSLVLFLSFLFLSRMRVAIYHPSFLFCLYYLVGFVARPFLIARNGYSQIWIWVGRNPTSADLVSTTIASNIGLLAFVFAPLVLDGKIYNETKVPYIGLFSGNPRNFMYALLGFGLLGLGVTFITIGNGEDQALSYQTQYLDGGGQALVGTSGYLTMISEYLGATLVIAICWLRKPSYAIAMIIPFALLRFYLGSQRSALIALLICTVIVFLSRTGRRVPPLKVVVLSILVLFAFNEIGTNRFVVRNWFSAKSVPAPTLTLDESQRAEQGMTADFSEFDSASATIGAVDYTGVYNWGLQYTRLLIWPIPRQIWPDKPVMVDRVPFETFGNFQVITKSIIGDSYSDFGLASVFLMMAIISISLASFHAKVIKMQRAGGSALGPIVYLIILGNTPLLFRDNFVSAAYFVLAILPMVWATVKIGSVSMEALPPAPVNTASLGLRIQSAG